MAKRNYLTSVWNLFYIPAVILRLYYALFFLDLSYFPYLIMAASEREERGGAICQRGAKIFQFGDTNIVRDSHNYFVQRISPLKFRSFTRFFNQSAFSPKRNAVQVCGEGLLCDDPKQASKAKGD